MHFIRSIRRSPGLRAGCALTIGNFDGLHSGHQAIIREVREHATELGVPAALMSFEPMPRLFFDPANAPARLSSLREKIEDSRAMGIDVFVCARFNRQFASLSADAFLNDLIRDRLSARCILVGEDFRFGKARTGDMNTLRAFAERERIALAPQPEVCIDGERVSSTRIRVALGAGDTAQAARLLGRRYRVSGRVATGQKLGRTLGFPTVNLRLQRRPALRYGVYAVRVDLADGRCCEGAASFGVRPTVAGHEPLLEIYLLDFSGDLYGQRINVFFHAFIRDEEHYDSLDALTEQMHRDVADVRACLTAETP